jgi:hypothetical protein
MRLSISLVLGSVAVTVASPMTSAPLIRRDVGENVAGIGQCPVSSQQHNLEEAVS